MLFAPRATKTGLRVNHREEKSIFTRCCDSLHNKSESLALRFRLRHAITLEIRMRFRRFAPAALAVLALSAGGAGAGCGGYVSAYEKAVFDFEPVYCYRNLGNVDCYAAPVYRDRRQLVNYFGPSPTRTPAPEMPDIRLDPPPPVFWFWRDPEPALRRPAFLTASPFEDAVLPAGSLAGQEVETSEQQ